MMPVSEVHAHPPSGIFSEVNSIEKASSGAPKGINWPVLGVKAFPPALAQARAVMVKNAGHPYLMKKGGGDSK